jgi:hypothetical protein
MWQQRRAPPKDTLSTAICRVILALLSAAFAAWLTCCSFFATLLSYRPRQRPTTAALLAAGTPSTSTCVALTFDSAADVLARPATVAALLRWTLAAAGSACTSVLLFEPTDALLHAGNRIADALESCRDDSRAPDKIVLGWRPSTGHTVTSRVIYRRRPRRPRGLEWFGRNGASHAADAWTVHVWLLGAADGFAQPMGLALLPSPSTKACNGGSVPPSFPATQSHRVVAAYEALADAQLQRERCSDGDDAVHKDAVPHWVHAPPAPGAVLCVASSSAAAAAFDCGALTGCDTLSLAGFPPWLCACAEVQPLPALRSVTSRHVATAVSRLAACVQRHGA